MQFGYKPLRMYCITNMKSISAAWVSPMDDIIIPVSCQACDLGVETWSHCKAQKVTLVVLCHLQKEHIIMQLKS